MILQKNEKQVVTARIDKELVQQVKDIDVPVSRVVAAGITYFLKLSDTDKKKWLLNNTPEIEDKLKGEIPSELLALPIGAIMSMITPLFSAVGSAIIFKKFLDLAKNNND